MNLKLLVEYCDKYLKKDEFKDYCPNGLQVEGSPQVSSIVAGVTACEALIDAAIEREAQAILVHHGYFWKGENQSLVGIKGNRIRKLMKHDISLLAYHLPLDAHSEIGNNAQFAKKFNIAVSGSFYPASGKDIALYGELNKQTNIDVLVAEINKGLGREALLLQGSDRPVKKIAWCSGGAQNGFEQAIALGVDLYISGEVSENTFHLAKESGVHYLAAGHHVTERFGVKALGQHLNKQFDVVVEFVDIYNPV